MRVVGQEQARRKIEDTVKSTEKMVTMQEKLNRAVIAGDRTMARFLDKTIKATDRATKSVQEFNKQVEKMSRNERDMAFNEQFGKGRAGRLANPFTGQGMTPVGAAQAAGGKLSAMDKIGNTAAMLAVFDTFTNSIGTLGNSIKNFDGSVTSVLRVMGDLSGTVFYSIGMFKQLKDVMPGVLLALTTFKSRLAMPGGVGGVGGAVLGGTAVAAAIALPILTWMERNKAIARGEAAASSGAAAQAEMKAMMEIDKRISDVAGNENGLLALQREFEQFLKGRLAVIAAEGILAELGKIAKPAEEIQKQEKIIEKQVTSTDRLNKTMERVILVTENALSKSEAFLKALLPNSFAQPLLAGAPQQTSALGAWVNQKMGTQDMTIFQKNAQTDLEGLGEAFAKGVKKKARPATKYDATRLLDGALGAHH